MILFFPVCGAVLACVGGMKKIRAPALGTRIWMLNV